MTWLALLAQADPQQAPPWFTYLPFIVLALMVVMFFRSSARQRREMQNALAALKKNDKVVTRAGILGVVVAIKENEDEVTLKVDDATNTRVRVLKSSIDRILSGDAPAAEAKP